MGRSRDLGETYRQPRHYAGQNAAASASPSPCIDAKFPTDPGSPGSSRNPTIRPYPIVYYDFLTEHSAFDQQHHIHPSISRPALLTGVVGNRLVLAHPDRLQPCSVDTFLDPRRSEEHTSELQSLMRNSYAVFCLNKKKEKFTQTH